jgi:hypothetical protein
VVAPAAVLLPFGIVVSAWERLHERVALEVGAELSVDGEIALVEALVRAEEAVEHAKNLSLAWGWGLGAHTAV